MTTEESTESESEIELLAKSDDAELGRAFADLLHVNSDLI